MARMTQPPTLVLLHFLGGSSRTWKPVIARFDGEVPTLTIDLPGFGDAASMPGDGVAAMADAAAAQIGAAGLSRYVLVGHSMGAKVAAVLARRSEDGEAGLAGLRSLVLMAGSPPGPEPMEEASRQKMLSFFAADPATHRQQAQGFVDENVSAPLPSALNDIAVEDVLRADPDRWRAWLTGGSNEDWADRVGVLHSPALILAGADDPALGPDAQHRLTAPHFATAHVVALPDTKHLLPLEQPNQVASLLGEHIR